MPRRIGRALAWLGRVVRSPIAPPEPPPDPDELARFDAHLLRMTHPAYSRLLLLVALVSLLWWPIDLLTEHDNPERMHAFGWIRGLLALACTTSAFVMWRLGPGRATYVVFGAAALAVHAILGGFMATLPGVSGLQFFYALPLIAIIVPLRLSRRVVFVFGLVVAFWVPAILAGDQTLAEIGAPVSFGVGVGCTSILFGHWLLMLLLANHINKLRLDSLHATLEQRVAAQSHELRALASSVVQARDAERAMLTRELHDAMGQEVTAIRYAVAFADRCARDAGDTLPSGLGFAIGQLSELVARMNDTTKRLLLRMRPREIEELGLARALAWLVVEARAPGSPEVTLEVQGADLDDVDPRAADVAFRAVQEGLANARRHAPSARVHVSVTRTAATLRLSVEDDGDGAPSPSPGTGLGLVGIRERAADANATVRWGPRPGGGFALLLEIPHPRGEVPDDSHRPG